MAEDVFGIIGTVQADAFKVEQVVAEGGFAVVYRAYHSAFRASVALKCLKVPGRMSTEDQAEFLEKFREEAEVLFRLSSAIPNIVRPLHVGTLNQPDGRFVPFLAIEWLEGETLDQLVATRTAAGLPPMDLARAMELLAPVARSLEHAHSFPGPEGVISVVHRDLKPENIFVARIHGKEVPKVLDFGIAKVKSKASAMVGHESARKTALGAFTPAYGAPEQWMPKRFGQTGPWTDVWGLAITAVECLVGRAPVDGEIGEMMGSIIDPARRPTPRTEGATVSDEVEAVFLKALAVDPKERYHRIVDFWSDLVRAARPQAAGAARPGVVVSRPPAGVAPRAAAVANTVQMPPPVSVAPAGPDLVPDLVVASSKKPPANASVRPRGAVLSPSAAPRSGGGPPAELIGKTVSSFDDDFDFDPKSPFAIQVESGHEAASPRAPANQPAVVPRVVASVPRGASTLYERSAPDAGRPLDIKGPIQVLVASILLMAADWFYAASTGAVFQVGPARAFWIAGPLAIYGVVTLALRLVRHGE